MAKKTILEEERERVRRERAEGNGCNSRNGKAGKRLHQTDGVATPSKLSQDAPNTTDTGNARRLVQRHGNDLRYCHPWRKWLVWAGSHWHEDDTGEIERRAKDTVAEIGRAAAEVFGNRNATREEKERADELISWALKSESAKLIGWMIDLAKSEGSIPILPSQLDRQQWLLSVRNGTID